MRRSRLRVRNPSRPSRRSTWIVALARTLRTGKSDSEARSPLSSTTPGAERPERRTRVELLAVAGRRSGGPLRARERPQELHLSVALRARDSDDLAARHLEVDRPEPVAPQSRDREQYLALRLALVALGGNASWSGRPIMSATRLSSDIEAASNVPWHTPSRRTLIRSAMPRTSGRRWLT